MRTRRIGAEFAQSSRSFVTGGRCLCTPRSRGWRHVRSATDPAGAPRREPRPSGLPQHRTASRCGHLRQPDRLTAASRSALSCSARRVCRRRADPLGRAAALGRHPCRGSRRCDLTLDGSCPPRDRRPTARGRLGDRTSPPPQPTREDRSPGDEYGPKGHHPRRRHSTGDLRRAHARVTGDVGRADTHRRRSAVLDQRALAPVGRGRLPRSPEHGGSSGGGRAWRERKPGGAGLLENATVLGTESGRAETSTEFLLARACVRAGLPRPAINEWMRLPGARYRPDLWWHDARLVVEIDGGVHQRPARRRADALRDDTCARTAFRCCASETPTWRPTPIYAQRGLAPRWRLLSPEIVQGERNSATVDGPRESVAGNRSAGTEFGDRSGQPARSSVDTDRKHPSSRRRPRPWRRGRAGPRG